MAGVPRFNFRMAFRKAPIDRPVNCPDVAMLSRHDDAPHVVCSTISRFCRCRGIAVARDHFGGGRLLISSASEQLCLLRDKVKRDPPLVRDYRGRNAGLATPQWPLATFRVSKFAAVRPGFFCERNSPLERLRFVQQFCSISLVCRCECFFTAPLRVPRPPAVGSSQTSTNRK